MAGVGFSRLVVAAGCVLIGAGQAQAQDAVAKPADAPAAQSAPIPTAPKAAPKPPAAKARTVDEVTVTGAAPPEVETSLDRKSYTLGKDLQSTTGSVADALRTLPSVDVDVQGNLSLRGDPNVTILVDGKPSPQFDGKDRADALQQLPADQIERVEVITNPSAALNPEGTGGVINLIMKKSRGAGATGSAYVTAASAGLKRAGASFGYNAPKLAVTGSVAGNYQRNKQHNEIDHSATDPVTGQVLNSFDSGIGRNLTRGPTVRLSSTYTPDAKDQITGAGSYSEMLVQGHPFDRYGNTDEDGTPISVLERQGERRYLETDNSLSAGWKHTFGEGRDLSIDAVYNDSLDRDHRIYTSNQILPRAVVPLQGIRDDETDHHAELTAAYEQPLAGGALKAGYELKHDDNDFNYAVSGGLTQGGLVGDPALANHFLFHQTINAAYVTYQHAFGDLDAQAGLRVEDVRLRLAQLTSGERDGQDYAKAYPTLHLGYKLDDQRKVTASFSERAERPPSVLLNPLAYLGDPTQVQTGNPALRPLNTTSYELGYEQHVGQTFYQATAYYRRYTDQVSQVVRDLGDGVFEYTVGNIGRSQTAGLELVANGKLTSKLSYNVSSNFSWRQIDAANLVAGQPSQQAYGVSGRASLNWQVRPDDMLQFNIAANGKRLSAQGVQEPNYAVNLGWRHKVNDRVTATMTVQDLTAAARFQRRLASPGLTEDLDVRPVFRSVFFRLDYRFGGKGKAATKDPGFEYENGGGAPG